MGVTTGCHARPKWQSNSRIENRQTGRRTPKTGNSPRAQRLLRGRIGRREKGTAGDWRTSALSIIERLVGVAVALPPRIAVRWGWQCNCHPNRTRHSTRDKALALCASRQAACGTQLVHCGSTADNYSTSSRRARHRRHRSRRGHRGHHHDRHGHHHRRRRSHHHRRRCGASCLRPHSP
jgi:hypothetical protein